MWPELTAPHSIIMKITTHLQNCCDRWALTKVTLTTVVTVAATRPTSLPWNSGWTCGKSSHRSSPFYTDGWNSLQLWEPGGKIISSLLLCKKKKKSTAETANLVVKPATHILNLGALKEAGWWKPLHINNSYKEGIMTERTMLNIHPKTDILHLTKQSGLEHTHTHTRLIHLPDCLECTTDLKTHAG